MANPFSSFFSTVASWFRQQRTTVSGLYPYGSMEVYPNIDSNAAITRGFDSNTAVYSIIKKDAKKFGCVARYVEAKSNEQKSRRMIWERKEVEALPGPLTDLLMRPNSSQGQDAFFTLVRAFYKTCGEAFIWLNRGDTDTLVDDTLVTISDEAQAKKPVLEMFVLPSNQVIVVPDPQNIFGIYGYILESNIRVPIRKVDMIHWKDVNLDFDIVSRTHLRGRSPLASGFKTLEANNSATDVTVRMNQNGGAKKVLANEMITSQNPMQESQLKKIFSEKINNIDMKGAVTALQGKWTGIDLGMTSVDLDVLRGKDYSMKELCFLLGMPFELFDSETTYQNKEMAQKGWVINEIMPDCKQLDGEMSRVLLPAFGLDKTAAICSDFDDMPELQEDKAKQVEWLSKAPITIDEFREALGYEEIGGDEGETIIIPTGLQTLDDLIAGDSGEEIISSLYGANGKETTKTTRTPLNGVAAKTPVKT